MKKMKYMALAAVACFAVSSASAGIVFSDTFEYAVIDDFAGAGWTTVIGTPGANIGVDALPGGGFLWGNACALEYNNTPALVLGDTITMDANIGRTGAQYGYTMTVDLWDGSDAGTRTTVAGGTEEFGLAALTQVSYTVGAADVGKQVIFNYAQSTNWGETNDVSFAVNAIPEPATLGMVAAFGGGILFIRRKLMM